mgnify:CR=1 FL=1
MTTANALLMLVSETSVHAGAGQSASGIDLPIQREVHSGWPCVYGSSMKGALRSKAERSGLLSRDKTVVLFGPEVSGDKQGDDVHAGSLMVGDARLLLLPVRSLSSHFKWVTCPALITRFLRDAKRLGVAVENVTLPALSGTNALTLKSDGDLFLEEYRLQQKQTPALTSLIKMLDEFSKQGLSAASLENQLVVVSDDIFGYLSRHATAVTPHIAIDSATKTVKVGALWHEESLPPETVLYMALASTDARRKSNDSPAPAAELLKQVTVTLLGAATPYLQIGGNETTGMGWCRVTVTVAAQG